MRSAVILLALVAGLAGESLGQGAAGAAVTGAAAAADAAPGAAVTSSDTTALVELSLDDAIRSAAQRSDEARLARSQVEVAQAQVASVRSAALPQVNANLGYTRTFKSLFDSGSSIELPDSMRFSPDPSLPLSDRITYLEDNAGLAGLGGLGSLFGNLPFGQKNAYSAGISASQLLYSGGRTGAALDIARSYRSASESQLVEQLSEVEFQVKGAYYQALFAQELQGAAREALDQAERFLEQERLRHEAGRSSELDLMRAEVARENLRPRLVEAQNAAELARLNLLRLVGLPLTQQVQLSTPLEVPAGASGAAIDPLELRNRPALDAMARQVEIREGQVKVARGEFLPSVAVQMNYGRQMFPTEAFRLDGEWRTDWSATVGVQIPLFSGLKRKAELDKARVELEQARLQLSQVRKQVELEFEQARGERDRSLAEIAARGRTVEQAQRVYDLTALRYERGLATQLEVSEARLALLQARTNQAQALRDYHTAGARLVRALGQSSVTAYTGRR
jgi:outer membrane protein TolC